jgi:hypothetical protein
MKAKIRWIALGVGIGIAMSFGVLCVYGPRGSKTEIDLYTGVMWTSRHHWLWGGGTTVRPAAPHTEWAKSHTVPENKYWPLFVSSQGRSLFASGTVLGAGEVSRKTHELPVSEERKIALLREFHEDADRVVEGSRDPFRKLAKQWFDKLEGMSAEPVPDEPAPGEPAPGEPASGEPEP